MKLFAFSKNHQECQVFPLAYVVLALGSKNGVGLKLLLRSPFIKIKDSINPITYQPDLLPCRTNWMVQIRKSLGKWKIFCYSANVTI